MAEPLQDGSPEGCWRLAENRGYKTRPAGRRRWGKPGSKRPKRLSSARLFLDKEAHRPAFGQTVDILEGGVLFGLPQQGHGLAQED